MVRNPQRTLFNIDLHLHQLLGKDYEAPENTTLNEKFQILPNEKLPTGIYPTLNYYAIGCGGNVVVDNVGTYHYSEHLPVDAALFQHVPFVMRDISNVDLTLTERSNYRLRLVKNYNGINYACYYLKVVPSYDLKPIFHKIRTLESGTSISSPTLSIMDLTQSSILNPVPVIRDLTYKNQNEIGFVTKIAKLTFSLTPAEIIDIQNCLKIMSLDNKNISEIGLVTGHDITVGGAKEVISAQIAIHLGVNLDLTAEIVKGKTIMKTIEIGGGEPLIN